MMPALRATYRVQLHGEFPFEQATQIIPYLARLGVSHLYSSPILRARTGSRHGYDLVDPTCVHPELGDDADRLGMVRELRRLGMGLLLDIVPNHMATGAENPFWEDVLTHGPSSHSARWFDIDWRSPDPELWGRVLIPVLGSLRHEVLARDEISLRLIDGQVRLAYFESSFPLDPSTTASPLAFDPGLSAERLGVPGHVAEALADLVRRLRALPPRTATDPTLRAERYAAADECRGHLCELVSKNAEAAGHIERIFSAFSGGTAGRNRLVKLMDRQVYRLAHWRRAAREINYRRFFDINDLIALRTEDSQVFEETHRLVFCWLAAHEVDALRIDHIDGLSDPRGYLENLSRNATELTGVAVPVFAEKILGGAETLRSEWPIAGTTGYDFLAEVEGIFLESSGLRRIEDFYRRRILRTRLDFAQTAGRAKRRALKAEFSASVGRLARDLAFLSRAHHPDMNLADAAQAITELIAALPVYRTYIAGDRRSTGSSPAHAVHPADRELIMSAAKQARERVHAAAVLDRLVSALLLEGLDEFPPDQQARRFRFVSRFQQLCGAAAAKGIEDTAFYVYVPLVSRNEVGGDPGRSAADADVWLHARNQSRAASWPHALLTVTTHDTKRSADVRARLDVLSEMSREWLQRVRQWTRWNRPHARKVAGQIAPDRNTEYLLYQTLVGAWPLSALMREEASEMAAFRERIEQYMIKAAREAKTQTSWVDPDSGFEEALIGFIRGILPTEGSARFLDDLRAFVGLISRPGMWNSISRTIIQLTAPGVPDTYQGDELWNFSLVDPDNRRPVDFSLRDRLLSELEAAWDHPGDKRMAFVNDLVSAPEDGRIKLHVIHRALAARAEEPDLFASGNYLPLSAEGAHFANIFAFAREFEAQVAITIAPRFTTQIIPRPTGPPTGETVWSDSRLRLPVRHLARGFRSVLTGESFVARSDGEPYLPIADVLGSFPAALLIGVGG